MATDRRGEFAMIRAAAFSLIIISTAAAASETQPPIIYNNSTGNVIIRANDTKSQIGTLSNGVFVPANVPDGTNLSSIKKVANSLASNTVYATGTVTYSTGTYTAVAGAQPIPAALAAGQTYFVNFPSSQSRRRKFNCWFSLDKAS